MKLTLKGIRNNLNLSQYEMAEKLGITRETYQNYENYKTFPDVIIAKKILEISQANFDDIIFLPSEFAKSDNLQSQEE